MIRSFSGDLELEGMSAEGRVEDDEIESNQTFSTYRIICTESDGGSRTSRAAAPIHKDGTRTHDKAMSVTLHLPRPRRAPAMK